MTKTYKVGDRVAVYGGGKTVDTGDFYAQSGIKGTVVTVYGQDTINVKLDMPNRYAETILTVHPKQCRRLKKKVLRTIYVPKDLGSVALNFSNAEDLMHYLCIVPSPTNTDSCIKFKEQK